jgi:FKBP-type peptidyl-prolyl cis-trans isomerase 2
MENEKIAAIALVIIIVGALSVFLLLQPNEDGTGTILDEILKNLFGEEKKVIEFGDCIDVNYIGRHTNGTIFDSSYEYPENKIDGTPLKIFVSLNKTEPPPKGFENYSSGFIDGLIEGLVGLAEDANTNINVPPEKGYGANKLGVGSTFYTSMIAIGLNQSVEVVNFSNERISLKWINVEELNNFTAPQFVVIDFNKLELGDQLGAIEVFPPVYIWENATNIVNITDDSVIVTATPTKSENITEMLTPIYLKENLDAPAHYILPDKTIATWNDTTITLTSSPEIGDRYVLSQEFFGQIFNTTYTVENITEDKINFSSALEGDDVSEDEKTYEEINRTITFDRTFTIPRNYDDISMALVSYIYYEDIERAGYSIHELAGEDLVFEVTIEKIYKKI